MHYSKINGPGIRTSLFVSGCENHCKGCFNPETWNKTNGQEFTKETLEYLLDSIDKDYCAGLSLLGGDPFAPYNIDTVIISSMLGLTHVAIYSTYSYIITMLKNIFGKLLKAMIIIIMVQVDIMM